MQARNQQIIQLVVSSRIWPSPLSRVSRTRKCTISIVRQLTKKQRINDLQMFLAKLSKIFVAFESTTVQPFKQRISKYETISFSDMLCAIPQRQLYIFTVFFSSQWHNKYMISPIVRSTLLGLFIFQHIAFNELSIFPTDTFVIKEPDKSRREGVICAQASRKYTGYNLLFRGRDLGFCYYSIKSISASSLHYFPSFERVLKVRNCCFMQFAMLQLSGKQISQQRCYYILVFAFVNMAFFRVQHYRQILRRHLLHWCSLEKTPPYFFLQISQFYLACLSINIFLLLAIHFDLLDNSSFYFFNLLILLMWKLKDSNVRIGEFIKVQTFKKHLLRLNSTASNLNQKNIKPWAPNFSISRNQNRYHKQKSGEIDKQNYHLLRRIADIQYNSKVTTLMDVPLYIPSNKENYVRFRNRERSVQSKRISRQNSMISSRIKSTERLYERRTFEEDWQKSRMVMKNIAKKHRCRDYRKLAQSQLRDKRKTTHPQMSLNLNRLRQRKQITQQKESMIDRSSVQHATERSSIKLKRFL